jgi:hypothetical protein
MIDAPLFSVLYGGLSGSESPMKCRHCLVEFHADWAQMVIATDKNGGLGVKYAQCPACERLNLALIRGMVQGSYLFEESIAFVHPRSVSREPLDPAVPADFSDDYNEACNVLDISPKASAALSRRCLQHILHDCAKVKERNLDQEIQKVLDGNMLPSHIAESLDAIRTVGNFAAHPIKSTSSGEIVEVEAGEAQWNLDTVEALFDFYFVGPAKNAIKKAALNQKLKDAGKPPLK